MSVENACDPPIPLSITPPSKISALLTPLTPLITADLCPAENPDSNFAATTTVPAASKDLRDTSRNSDSGKSSSCSPTLLDCSFDSGIAGVLLDANDMQRHKHIQQCQRILLALERDREHFCAIRNRLSKITERKKKIVVETDYLCNVCCAEIDPENANTYVKCSICQKYICQSIKCADWLAKTAQWECELCQTSKESLAQTSSWVADQLSFNQQKLVHPMRARSEIFIPISDRNDSSIHFESVSQIGANVPLITAEQKLKIREYVEEIVSNLLGGSLDAISVTQLSKSENYLPAPKTNGHVCTGNGTIPSSHQEMQNGIIKSASPDSRESTPGPDFADVSEARLRNMIQKIIAESVHIAPLTKASYAVSEIALDRPGKLTENMGFASNGLRHRTEHYFEPTIYQDLLATAVLNKIVDKQSNNNNNRNMSESSPDLSRREEIDGVLSDVVSGSLDHNYNIENHSITSGSSVEPRSDSSYTDTEPIVTTNDDKSSELVLDAGRDSALSDYIAAHMVPLPDISRLANESEEDDYMSVTSSAIGDSTWENNWLFKKKKSTVSTSLGGSSAGMLVPDPKEDVRAQIGDKTADEISDLSELGSDTDDSSMDLLRTAVDPINDRLFNKHLIGGQNSKMVLDELIERSSMTSNTLPTDQEHIYTETCNENIEAPTRAEAINSSVTTQQSCINHIQTNNNEEDQKNLQTLQPPEGFDDSNSNPLTAGDEFDTDSEGCVGFGQVEVMEPSSRTPSVIEILAAMALGPMIAIPTADEPAPLTPNELNTLQELRDLALTEIKTRSMELMSQSLSVIPEEMGEIDLKNFPTLEEIDEMQFDDADTENDIPQTVKIETQSETIASEQDQKDVNSETFVKEECSTTLKDGGSVEIMPTNNEISLSDETVASTTADVQEEEEVETKALVIEFVNPAPTERIDTEQILDNKTNDVPGNGNTEVNSDSDILPPILGESSKDLQQNVLKEAETKLDGASSTLAESSVIKSSMPTTDIKDVADTISETITTVDAALNSADAKDIIANPAEVSADLQINVDKDLVTSETKTESVKSVNAFILTESAVDTSDVPANLEKASEDTDVPCTVLETDATSLPPEELQINISNLSIASETIAAVSPPCLEEPSENTTDIQETSSSPKVTEASDTNVTDSIKVPNVTTVPEDSSEDLQPNIANQMLASELSNSGNEPKNLFCEIESETQESVSEKSPEFVCAASTCAISNEANANDQETTVEITEFNNSGEIQSKVFPLQTPKDIDTKKAIISVESISRSDETQVSSSLSLPPKEKPGSDESLLIEGNIISLIVTEVAESHVSRTVCEPELSPAGQVSSLSSTTEHSEETLKLHKGLCESIPPTEAEKTSGAKLNTGEKIDTDIQSTTDTASVSSLEIATAFQNHPEVVEEQATGASLEMIPDGKLLKDAPSGEILETKQSQIPIGIETSNEEDQKMTTHKDNMQTQTNEGLTSPDSSNEQTVPTFIPDEIAETSQVPEVVKLPSPAGPLADKTPELLPPIDYGLPADFVPLPPAPTSLNDVEFVSPFHPEEIVETSQVSETIIAAPITSEPADKTLEVPSPIDDKLSAEECKSSNKLSENVQELSSSSQEASENSVSQLVCPLAQSQPEKSPLTVEASQEREINTEMLPPSTVVACEDSTSNKESTEILPIPLNVIEEKFAGSALSEDTREDKSYEVKAIESDKNDASSEETITNQVTPNNNEGSHLLSKIKLEQQNESKLKDSIDIGRNESLKHAELVKELKIVEENIQVEAEEENIEVQNTSKSDILLSQGPKVNSDELVTVTEPLPTEPATVAESIPLIEEASIEYTYSNTTDVEEKALADKQELIESVHEETTNIEESIADDKVVVPELLVPEKSVDSVDLKCLQNLKISESKDNINGNKDTRVTQVDIGMPSENVGETQSTNTDIVVTDQNPMIYENVSVIEATSLETFEAPQLNSETEKMTELEKESQPQAFPVVAPPPFAFSGENTEASQIPDLIKVSVKYSEEEDNSPDIVTDENVPKTPSECLARSSDTTIDISKQLENFVETLGEVGATEKTTNIFAIQVNEKCEQLKDQSLKMVETESFISSVDEVKIEQVTVAETTGDEVTIQGSEICKQVAKEPLSSTETVKESESAEILPEVEKLKTNEIEANDKTLIQASEECEQLEGKSLKTVKTESFISSVEEVKIEQITTAEETADATAIQGSEKCKQLKEETLNSCETFKEFEELGKAESSAQILPDAEKIKIDEVVAKDKDKPLIQTSEKISQLEDDTENTVETSTNSEDVLKSATSVKMQSDVEQGCIEEGAATENTADEQNNDESQNIVEICSKLEESVNQATSASEVEEMKINQVAATENTADGSAIQGSETCDQFKEESLNCTETFKDSEEFVKAESSAEIVHEAEIVEIQVKIINTIPIQHSKTCDLENEPQNTIETCIESEETVKAGSSVEIQFEVEKKKIEQLEALTEKAADGSGIQEAEKCEQLKEEPLTTVKSCKECEIESDIDKGTIEKVPPKEKTADSCAIQGSEECEQVGDESQNTIETCKESEEIVKAKSFGETLSEAYKMKIDVEVVGKVKNGHGSAFQGNEKSFGVPVEDDESESEAVFLTPPQILASVPDNLETITELESVLTNLQANLRVKETETTLPSQVEQSHVTSSPDIPKEIAEKSANVESQSATTETVDNTAVAQEVSKTYKHTSLTVLVEPTEAKEITSLNIKSNETTTSDSHPLIPCSESIGGTDNSQTSVEIVSSKDPESMENVVSSEISKTVNVVAASNDGTSAVQPISVSQESEPKSTSVGMHEPSEEMSSSYIDPKTTCIVDSAVEPQVTLASLDKSLSDNVYSITKSPLSNSDIGLLEAKTKPKKVRFEEPIISASHTQRAIKEIASILSAKPDSTSDSVNNDIIPPPPRFSFDEPDAVADENAAQYEKKLITEPTMNSVETASVEAIENVDISATTTNTSETWPTATTEVNNNTLCAEPTQSSDTQITSRESQPVAALDSVYAEEKVTEKIDQADMPDGETNKQLKATIDEIKELVLEPEAIETKPSIEIDQKTPTTFDDISTAPQATRGNLESVGNSAQNTIKTEQNDIKFNEAETQSTQNISSPTVGETALEATQNVSESTQPQSFKTDESINGEDKPESSVEPTDEITIESILKKTELCTVSLADETTVPANETAVKTSILLAANVNENLPSTEHTEVNKIIPDATEVYANLPSSVEIEIDKVIPKATEVNADLPPTEECHASECAPLHGDTKSLQTKKAEEDSKCQNVSDNKDKITDKYFMDPHESETQLGPVVSVSGEIFDAALAQSEEIKVEETLNHSLNQDEQKALETRDYKETVEEGPLTLSGELEQKEQQPVAESILDDSPTETETKSAEKRNESAETDFNLQCSSQISESNANMTKVETTDNAIEMSDSIMQPKEPVSLSQDATLPEKLLPSKTEVEIPQSDLLGQCSLSDDATHVKTDTISSEPTLEDKQTNAGLKLNDHVIESAASLEKLVSCEKVSIQIEGENNASKPLSPESRPVLEKSLSKVSDSDDLAQTSESSLFQTVEIEAHTTQQTEVLFTTRETALNVTGESPKSLITIPNSDEEIIPQVSCSDILLVVDEILVPVASQVTDIKQETNFSINPQDSATVVHSAPPTDSQVSVLNPSVIADVSRTEETKTYSMAADNRTKAAEICSSPQQEEATLKIDTQTESQFSTSGSSAATESLPSGKDHTSAEIEAETSATVNEPQTILTNAPSQLTAEFSVATEEFGNNSSNIETHVPSIEQCPIVTEPTRQCLSPAMENTLPQLLDENNSENKNIETISALTTDVPQNVCGNIADTVDASAETSELYVIDDFLPTERQILTGSVSLAEELAAAMKADSTVIKSENQTKTKLTPKIENIQEPSQSSEQEIASTTFMGTESKPLLNESENILPSQLSETCPDPPHVKEISELSQNDIVTPLETEPDTTPVLDVNDSSLPKETQIKKLETTTVITLSRLVEKTTSNKVEVDFEEYRETPAFQQTETDPFTEASTIIVTDEALEKKISELSAINMSPLVEPPLDTGNHTRPVPDVYESSLPQETQIKSLETTTTTVVTLSTPVEGFTSNEVEEETEIPFIQQSAIDPSNEDPIAIVVDQPIEVKEISEIPQTNISSILEPPVDTVTGTTPVLDVNESSLPLDIVINALETTTHTVIELDSIEDTVLPFIQQSAIDPSTETPSAIVADQPIEVEEISEIPQRNISSLLEPSHDTVTGTTPIPDVNVSSLPQETQKKLLETTTTTAVTLSMPVEGFSSNEVEVDSKEETELPLTQQSASYPSTEAPTAIVGDQPIKVEEISEIQQKNISSLLEPPVDTVTGTTPKPDENESSLPLETVIKTLETITHSVIEVDSKEEADISFIQQSAIDPFTEAPSAIIADQPIEVKELSEIPQTKISSLLEPLLDRVTGTTPISDVNVSSLPQETQKKLLETTTTTAVTLSTPVEGFTSNEVEVDSKEETELPLTQQSASYPSTEAPTAIVGDQPIKVEEISEIPQTNISSILEPPVDTVTGTTPKPDVNKSSPPLETVIKTLETITHTVIEVDSKEEAEIPFIRQSATDPSTEAPSAIIAEQPIEVKELSEIPQTNIPSLLEPSHDTVTGTTPMPDVNVYSLPQETQIKSVETTTTTVVTLSTPVEGFTSNEVEVDSKEDTEIPFIQQSAIDPSNEAPIAIVADQPIEVKTIWEIPQTNISSILEPPVDTVTGTTPVLDVNESSLPLEIVIKTLETTTHTVIEVNSREETELPLTQQSAINRSTETSSAIIADQPIEVKEISEIPQTNISSIIEPLDKITGTTLVSTVNESSLPLETVIKTLETTTDTVIEVGSKEETELPLTQQSASYPSTEAPTAIGGDQPIKVEEISEIPQTNISSLLEPPVDAVTGTTPKPDVNESSPPLETVIKTLETITHTVIEVDSKEEAEIPIIQQSAIDPSTEAPSAIIADQPIEVKELSEIPQTKISSILEPLLDRVTGTTQISDVNVSSLPQETQIKSLETTTTTVVTLSTPVEGLTSNEVEVDSKEETEIPLIQQSATDPSTEATTAIVDDQPIKVEEISEIQQKNISLLEPPHDTITGTTPVPDVNESPLPQETVKKTFETTITTVILSRTPVESLFINEAKVDFNELTEATLPQDATIETPTQIPISTVADAKLNIATESTPVLGEPETSTQLLNKEIPIAIPIREEVEKQEPEIEPLAKENLSENQSSMEFESQVGISSVILKEEKKSPTSKEGSDVAPEKIHIPVDMTPTSDLHILEEKTKESNFKVQINTKPSVISESVSIKVDEVQCEDVLPIQEDKLTSNAPSQETESTKDKKDKKDTTNYLVTKQTCPSETNILLIEPKSKTVISETSSYPQVENETTKGLLAPSEFSEVCAKIVSTSTEGNANIALSEDAAYNIIPDLRPTESLAMPKILEETPSGTSTPETILSTAAEIVVLEKTDHKCPADTETVTTLQVLAHEDIATALTLEEMQSYYTIEASSNKAADSSLDKIPCPELDLNLTPPTVLDVAQPDPILITSEETVTSKQVDNKPPPKTPAATTLNNTPNSNLYRETPTTEFKPRSVETLVESNVSEIHLERLSPSLKPFNATTNESLTLYGDFLSASEMPPLQTDSDIEKETTTSDQVLVDHNIIPTYSSVEETIDNDLSAAVTSDKACTSLLDKITTADLDPCLFPPSGLVAPNPILVSSEDTTKSEHSVNNLPSETSIDITIASRLDDNQTLSDQTILSTETKHTLSEPPVEGTPSEITSEALSTSSAYLTEEHSLQDSKSDTALNTPKEITTQSISEETGSEHLRQSCTETNPLSNKSTVEHTPCEISSECATETTPLFNEPKDEKNSLETFNSDATLSTPKGIDTDSVSEEPVDGHITEAPLGNAPSTTLDKMPISELDANLTPPAEILLPEPISATLKGSGTSGQSDNETRIKTSTDIATTSSLDDNQSLSKESPVESTVSGQVSLSSSLSKVDTAESHASRLDTQNSTLLTELIAEEHYEQPKSDPVLNIPKEIITQIVSTEIPLEKSEASTLSITTAQLPSVSSTETNIPETEVITPEKSSDFNVSHEIEKSEQTHNITTTETSLEEETSLLKGTPTTYYEHPTFDQIVTTTEINPPSEDPEYKATATPLFNKSQALVNQISNEQQTEDSLSSASDTMLDEKSLQVLEPSTWSTNTNSPLATPPDSILLASKGISIPEITENKTVQYESPTVTSDSNGSSTDTRHLSEEPTVEPIHFSESLAGASTLTKDITDDTLTSSQEHVTVSVTEICLLPNEPQVREVASQASTSDPVLVACEKNATDSEISNVFPSFDTNICNSDTNTTSTDLVTLPSDAITNASIDIAILEEGKSISQTEVAAEKTIAFAVDDSLTPHLHPNDSNNKTHSLSKDQKGEVISFAVNTQPEDAKILEQKACQDQIVSITETSALLNEPESKEVTSTPLISDPAQNTCQKKTEKRKEKVPPEMVLISTVDQTPNLEHDTNVSDTETSSNFKETDVEEIFCVKCTSLQDSMVSTKITICSQTLTSDTALNVSEVEAPKEDKNSVINPFADSMTSEATSQNTSLNNPVFEKSSSEMTASSSVANVIEEIPVGPVNIAADPTLNECQTLVQRQNIETNVSEALTAIPEANLSSEDIKVSSETLISDSTPSSTIPATEKIDTIVITEPVITSISNTSPLTPVATVSEELSKNPSEAIESDKLIDMEKTQDVSGLASISTQIEPDVTNNIPNETISSDTNVSEQRSEISVDSLPSALTERTIEKLTSEQADEKLEENSHLSSDFELQIHQNIPNTKELPSASVEAIKPVGTATTCLKTDGSVEIKESYPSDQEVVDGNSTPAEDKVASELKLSLLSTDPADTCENISADTPHIILTETTSEIKTSSVKVLSTEPTILSNESEKIKEPVDRAIAPTTITLPPPDDLMISFSDMTTTDVNVSTLNKGVATPSYSLNEAGKIYPTEVPTKCTVVCPPETIDKDKTNIDTQNDDEIKSFFCQSSLQSTTDLSVSIEDSFSPLLLKQATVVEIENENPNESSKSVTETDCASGTADETTVQRLGNNRLTLRKLQRQYGLEYTTPSFEDVSQYQTSLTSPPPTSTPPTISTSPKPTNSFATLCQKYIYDKPLLAALESRRRQTLLMHKFLSTIDSFHSSDGGDSMEDTNTHTEPLLQSNIHNTSNQVVVYSSASESCSSTTCSSTSPSSTPTPVDQEQSCHEHSSCDDWEGCSSDSYSLVLNENYKISYNFINNILFSDQISANVSHSHSHSDVLSSVSTLEELFENTDDEKDFKVNTTKIKKLRKTSSKTNKNTSTSTTTNNSAATYCHKRTKVNNNKMLDSCNSASTSSHATTTSINFATNTKQHMFEQSTFVGTKYPTAFVATNKAAYDTRTNKKMFVTTNPTSTNITTNANHNEYEENTFDGTKHPTTFVASNNVAYDTRKNKKILAPTDTTSTNLTKRNVYEENTFEGTKHPTTFVASNNVAYDYVANKDINKYDSDVSQTEEDEDELGILPRFVPGSIAEREYKKWHNAVEMPNNPYAPEALKRRISGSQERFIDLPNITSSGELCPLDMITKDKLTEDESNNREIEIKRYSRDYYINDSAKSSQIMAVNSDTSKDATETTNQQQAEPTTQQGHPSAFAPTTQETQTKTDIESASKTNTDYGTVSDIYTAIPAQVVEDNTVSSLDTLSQQSIQSTNTTTSDDSDTIKIYNFKKQETTIIKETKEKPNEQAEQVATQAARTSASKDRPTALGVTKTDSVANSSTVTTPTRGSTPEAFKFLQPKRRLLDPSKVLSVDEDEPQIPIGSIEKPVIEKEVVKALPSVKALAKAFLMTSASVHHSSTKVSWPRKAKTLPEGLKAPSQYIEPASSVEDKSEEDATIASDLSSLETDSLSTCPAPNAASTAGTTGSPVPVRQGVLKSNIAFFENLKNLK